MTDEVDWVLDQLGSVVDAIETEYGATVRRIDRDNSRVYDGGSTVDMTTPIRDRATELKQAAYVGASFADQTTSPVGTEYDLEFERVVEVRVEGMHRDEWGEIDPDGNNGVPFDDLVRRVQDTILDQRAFPAASERSDTQYHTLTVQNDAPQSHNYGDFYRRDFDVVPSGYRNL